MMQVNRKYAFWILVFVAASLITVLFLEQARVNVGVGVSKSIFIIANMLFYAVPITAAVYVISVAKRYVDCKVAESKMGCGNGCKDGTAEAANRAGSG